MSVPSLNSVKSLIGKSLRKNFRIKITSTRHAPHKASEKRILVDYSRRMENVFDEMTNEILDDLSSTIISNRQFFINLTVESPHGEEMTYVIEEPLIEDNSPSSENYFI